MRYSLSPAEYRLLHKYLIARTPVVKKKALDPTRYEQVIKESDDYNPSTIRLALRLFGSTFLALKLFENVAPRIMAPGKKIP